MNTEKILFDIDDTMFGDGSKIVSIANVFNTIEEAEAFVVKLDKLLNSEQNPERSVANVAPSEPQTPETLSHLKQISACFDSILSYETDDVIEFDAGACLYKIFNTARIGKQLADAVVKNV